MSKEISQKVKQFALTAGMVASMGLLVPAVAVAAPAEMSGVPTANEAVESSNATSYQASAREDGSVVVSLTNGSFEIRDGVPVILDGAGTVLESLPSTLSDAAGNVFGVKYALLNEDQIEVRRVIPESGLYSDRSSSWGEYGSCIAKNTAGGLVGGAAAGCVGGWLAPAPAVCASGAGAGAITGTVAAGVGSLFWCW